MQTKLLEIRDRSTLIIVVGIEIRADNALTSRMLQRNGYSPEPPYLILLGNVNGGTFRFDPYDWADRTYRFAHNYIEKHWNELVDGSVIDVEYILGETQSPKVSEFL